MHRARLITIGDYGRNIARMNVYIRVLLSSETRTSSRIKFRQCSMLRDLFIKIPRLAFLARLTVVLCAPFPRNIYIKVHLKRIDPT